MTKHNLLWSDGTVRCARAGRTVYRAAITSAIGIVRHSRRSFESSEAAEEYGYLLTERYNERRGIDAD